MAEETGRLSASYVPTQAADSAVTVDTASVRVTFRVRISPVSSGVTLTNYR